MDTQQTLAHEDYSANVDTSRPFSSVKEAVAVFGERLLLREIYSTTSDNNNNNPSRKYPTLPSPTTEQNPKKVELSDMLKKLEAEVEDTKMELKLLKEKESETEIALASLNAEVHKNMLIKMAEVKAETAMTRTSAIIDKEEKKEEERRMKKELMIRMENSTTLGEILGIGIGENGKYYSGGKIKERRVHMLKKKMMKKKKKLIVPMVSDFFFKEKGASSSSTTLKSLLYASSK